MPREILTDWTTPAGSGFRTVTFWDSAVAVEGQRAKWQAFLETINGMLVDGAQWVIRTEGREMDNTTGTLTGAWSDGTAQLGGGAGAGECVADATQILVRWNTETIVNGRFLRGRTFIPGAQQAALANGNLTAGNVTAINAACTAMLTDNEGFGIWHRPVNSAGGSFSLATSGNGWSELAVLRQRRA
jgi:hypothetical protein